jgi:hypothetical protein
LILVGVDKDFVPKGSIIPGDPLWVGFSGRYTIDMFQSTSGARMAAVDIDCETSVMIALRFSSVVNSRWFAIAVDRHLNRMLLFDFKSSGQESKNKSGEGDSPN